jgi:alkylation response protein AidB-like acyl-CoA dehydrogenase
MSVNNSLVCWGLETFGNEEQKDKYLPKLATGEWIGAFCLSEPEAGSDATSQRTTAEDKGDYYLLNGTKNWITNGNSGSYYLVIAQTYPEKGHKGINALIVEKDTPGVTVGAKENKLGIRGSDTHSIMFQDVKVPKANRIGDDGFGFTFAMKVLAGGRIGIAAQALGIASGAYELALKYSKERKAFGKEIFNHQAIAFKLADMYVKVTAAKLLVMKAAAEKDEGKDIAHSGAMAKLYASEIALEVANEAVQIHGGNGFSEEYVAARAYRDARINRIFEGTNEINRLLAFSMTMRRAMKGEIDLVGPAWAVQKELAAMPSNDKTDGAWGAEIDAVKNMKKIGLMVAGAAAKYQMDGLIDLKNEQEIVMNIADIMMDIYVAECVLLRIRKMESLGHNTDLQGQMMKVYFNDAFARISKNASDALSSFADGDALRMMLNGVKRFSKYEHVNVKNARRAVAKKLIEANAYCF